MEIIDRVVENVSVQIITSQARRMRLLEETGCKRFRPERDSDMTVHTSAELEALYKEKMQTNFKTWESTMPTQRNIEHRTLSNHLATGSL
jgi:hypothetical protein